MRLTPARQTVDPLVEALAALAEGELGAVIPSGDEAVQ